MRRLRGSCVGKEPRATVEAVRMGKKMMLATSAKAERELGLRRAAGVWRAAGGGGMVRGEWVCAEAAEDGVDQTGGWLP